MILRVADWWKGLEQKAKTITAIVAVVVAIAAFPLWLETRYATAEDVKAQVGSIKQLYLQSERRALRKELFDLQVREKQRRLTDLEQRRKQELEDELRQVNEQLKK